MRHPEGTMNKVAIIIVTLILVMAVGIGCAGLTEKPIKEVPWTGEGPVAPPEPGTKWVFPEESSPAPTPSPTPTPTPDVPPQSVEPPPSRLEVEHLTVEELILHETYYIHRGDCYIKVTLIEIVEERNFVRVLWEDGKVRYQEMPPIRLFKSESGKPLAFEELILDETYYCLYNMSWVTYVKVTLVEVGKTDPYAWIRWEEGMYKGSLGEERVKNLYKLKEER